MIALLVLAGCSLGPPALQHELVSVLRAQEHEVHALTTLVGNTQGGNAACLTEVDALVAATPEALSAALDDLDPEVSVDLFCVSADELRLFDAGECRPLVGDGPDLYAQGSTRDRGLSRTSYDRLWAWVQPSRPTLVLLRAVRPYDGGWLGWDPRCA